MAPKRKLEGVPFFRPARSVSGTRRRVTTEELELFKEEQAPPAAVPARSEPVPEASRSEAPAPSPPGDTPQSMHALRSPWVSVQPSLPPPPSPWVPAIDSMPPAAPATANQAPLSPRLLAITDDALRAGILSGIAGYVDAAGFLALFGLLPAHMTGDLVWAGAALTERAEVGWPLRLAMVALFIGSVAVAAVAARVVRRRGQSPLASLLSLMTIALAVFWAAGTWLGPLINGPDGTATLFISGAGVVAMGIQNALMREALGKLCPTTVMTGNLTQVTMDLVELAFASFDSPSRRPHSRRKDALARLTRYGLPIASFTVGAGVGACATNGFGFASLALPTVASLLLTAHSFRVART